MKMRLSPPPPFVGCRRKVKAVIWWRTDLIFLQSPSYWDGWVGYLENKFGSRPVYDKLFNSENLLNSISKIARIVNAIRNCFWVSRRHHKCQQIRSLGLLSVSVLKTLKYKGKWVSDAEIDCIAFSSSVSSPHTIKTFSVSTSKRFYFCSHIQPLPQSSSSTPTQLESLLEDWVELEKNYLGSFRVQFFSSSIPTLIRDWLMIHHSEWLTRHWGHIQSDNLQPPCTGWRLHEIR